jgi:hypothetical protein
MPVKNYYKGHGSAVLRSMRKRYGKKQGTRVFYATVNKWRTKGTKAQKAAQPKRAPGARRR